MAMLQLYSKSVSKYIVHIVERASGLPIQRPGMTCVLSVVQACLVPAMLG